MAVGVMVAGACTAGPLTADEQRAAMADTTRTVADRTADGMRTDSIEVTDDAAELRDCPDGGSRYVFAATIGPVGRDKLASTMGSALTRAENRFLGVVERLGLDPADEGLARFDRLDIADPAAAEDVRHATYHVKDGDLQGITLSFSAATAGADDIVVDVEGHTRCT